jgi:uncharacterized hydantoinase/oxoprolinase family protein
MSVLGLDIGGANIKAADESGRAMSRPLAVWRYPERIRAEVTSILREFPQTERIAVTMTAELADCFQTKREGVQFILTSLASVADELPIGVWATTGQFLTVIEACRQPMSVAAANWHALATWVGTGLKTGGQGIRTEERKFDEKAASPNASPHVWPSLSGQTQNEVHSAENSALSTKSRTPCVDDPSMDKRQSADSGRQADIRFPTSYVRHPTSDFGNQTATGGERVSALESFESVLLIDIGTTTTDVIPIVRGRPDSMGLSDVGRLQSGELSYSGVKRTPVCAVAHSVPFRDGYCPLAAELFATTLDVYLLLGDIAEDERDCETANGKPAMKAAAHDRIARSLCCDREEVSFEEAVQIARFLADVQRQRLAGSLERVAQRMSGPCQRVVASGSGAFLARRLISENRRTSSATILSLDKTLSPEIAEAACAFSVANLLHGSVPKESIPNPKRC